MVRMMTCQHCGRQITQLANGYWIDDDGMYACIKGPVLHQPMPKIIHDEGCGLSHTHPGDCRMG